MDGTHFDKGKTRERKKEEKKRDYGTHTHKYFSPIIKLLLLVFILLSFERKTTQ